MTPEEIVKRLRVYGISPSEETADLIERQAKALETARNDALEEAAAYVEGSGGRIPGAAVFATLVSRNKQPCMSGDPRDRLSDRDRRDFDDAMACLAERIRALKGEQNDA